MRCSNPLCGTNPCQGCAERLRARKMPNVPTPDMAGVPMRATELTTVRAVGGFVQTSQRFVGR